ncbi:hypothetical protein [Enterococcus sp. AZ192]|uniref:hypothetical protein n=1 Tax=unclassified Enterococcus TaxID=2608891 RepID=UPI003D2D229F
MAKTLGEVRSFLDSLIGKVTVDKSNSALNGQCVSLIKNVLEFVGAPNPYAARGNAKDIPSTYTTQGIAKVGSGTLNIAVNRNGGGGYGHVWVKIGSDSWQANWAGFPVKKNVGEDPITDILNLDQWISNGNISTSGELFDMPCFFEVEGDPTLYYFDGKGITGIAHPDEKGILNTIYKANYGKDMPTVRRAVGWFSRLRSVSTRPIVK